MRELNRETKRSFKMENSVLSMILDTDSYKLSHWVQYPPNTTAMSSYFESRGGRFPKTVFFGLQYYLKKYFSNPITASQVEEAKEFSALHGEPFNYEGWMGIVNECKGFLPVEIWAVPEGSVIPTHNVLFQVHSTNPKYFWVVSWIETMLVRMWYPITIATSSWTMKRDIRKWLEKSSDDPEGELPFKLHDFGSRGVTCQEQAMIGGAAHLVNFMGSDTIAGIWMANKYYEERMSGFSIPASEHSTITMWGRARETEAYRNMVKQYGSGNIFACVSDSYDFLNACGNIWGDSLKLEVEGMKAMLVARPDSGNPAEMVKDALFIFDEKFGSVENRKGYKVLNHVRVIQGDGINERDVNYILEETVANGFSATNVGFGMGGGLLQKDFDRDTNKFAFKCSWAMVDGVSTPVYKDPITDQVKKSKKGILDLQDMGMRKARTVSWGQYPRETSLLQRVYWDGFLERPTTFQKVRERSNKEPWGQYDGWVDKDVY